MRNEPASLDSILARMNQDTPPKKRGRFRYPTLPWRVLIVASLLGGLGAMGGLMAALFLGEALVCVMAGAFLGVIGGAVFEALPLTDSSERKTRDAETEH